MKYILSIISICLFLHSCDKKKTEIMPTIKYPNSGLYGTNVLNNDSLSFSTEKVYSIRAEVPSGMNLKLVITNLTDSVMAKSPGNLTLMYLGSIYGWKNLTYNTSGYSKVQEFIVEDEVKAEMRVFFVRNGSQKIELYENGSNSPIRTKTITWK